MSATVDWSRLADGFGPATTTPALLRRLSATAADQRAAARDELRERYLVDDAPTGLPAVVAAVVELAGGARPRDRAELILLALDLAVGDPDGSVVRSSRGELARTAVEQRALRAFAAIAPTLVDGLGGRDAAVRACCTRAAAFLARPGAAVLAALAAAGDDRDDHVRVGALLALATLARDGVKAAQRPYAAGRASAAPSVAALAAAVRGERADDAALIALAGALAEPAVARVRQPWAGGDLGDAAAAALTAAGARARVALPQLLDAVERTDDRARLRNAALALTVLLGEAARTIAPATLTADERAGLARLAAAGAPADYARYGLPGEPAALRRALGVGGAASSPVATELAIGAQPARPVWQWFGALFEGQIDRDALTAALIARFAPAALRALLRDATRGAFSAPLPPLALVEAVTPHLGDDPAAERALADDTLALPRDQLAPPAALLAVLPLARRGPLDARYHPLASRALRGNDKAVVGRLEALLGAALVAALRPPRK